MTGKQTRRGRIQLKQRYEQLKLQGICVTCGKEKATESTIRCLTCLEKKKASDRRGLIRKLAREARINFSPEK